MRFDRTLRLLQLPQRPLLLRLSLPLSLLPIPLFLNNILRRPINNLSLMQPSLLIPILELRSRGRLRSMMFQSDNSRVLGVLGCDERRGAIVGGIELRDGVVEIGHFAEVHHSCVANSTLGV